MSWRGRLVAALLLATLAALPQWLGHGAHLLGHDDYGHASGHAAGLAEALVHGHGHEKDVPEHEHRLLPAPSVRPDPPEELQAPAAAFLEAPGMERPGLAEPRTASGRTRLSGASPPRLHLLCTLLI